jgi:hypothetical protein
MRAKNQKLVRLDKKTKAAATHSGQRRALASAVLSLKHPREAILLNTSASMSDRVSIGTVSTASLIGATGSSSELSCDLHMQRDM